MKITPVAQPVLFVIGNKNYYLVCFKKDDPENSHTHREVRGCLREGGFIPANVRSGDEVVTHPKIVGHDGWIGLFGTFSDDPTEAHWVAFLKNREFRSYDESTGTPGLPHPVLCYK